ncbi:phosphoribosylglycinamide formyltransferase [Chitinophaga caeni]|uniref:Phosphoribosylglycinamide formyltransferase n=1 Tax=Chitinophaga caeni TaxID=2029983 RepID=A0A291R0U4_9BACT|nr:phosphoribosylglycinamide formyltransferase [Chitinophaga caeni]ATL49723.1 phosphoribosylglycinamide formyltransferase [Chitinophaga caeni]
MKNIAIFASGNGSNAQKIIDHFKGNDQVSVKFILCNKPGAGVFNIAEKEGIPSVLINREDFYKSDNYVVLLKEAGIDLVVLAGFLWKVPANLIEAFPNRIINIHPALLPKYGGKGMYGHFVHEAVVAAREQESGITIHYVNEHYDEGAPILQEKCVLSENDTPEDVARKVQALEHQWFPIIVERLLTTL